MLFMLFYFLALGLYFVVPLYSVIEFIISIVQFKKIDKAETDLWKRRKKKVTLFGILSVIFIGGMIAVPMLVSSFILSHM